MDLGVLLGSGGGKSRLKRDREGLGGGVLLGAGSRKEKGKAALGSGSRAAAREGEGGRLPVEKGGGRKGARAACLAWAADCWAAVEKKARGWGKGLGRGEPGGWASAERPPGRPSPLFFFFYSFFSQNSFPNRILCAIKF